MGGTEVAKVLKYCTCFDLYLRDNSWVSFGRDISAETVSYKQLYNKGKILGSHVGQSRLKEKISGEDDKN